MPTAECTPCMLQIIVIALPLWEGRDVIMALFGRDRRPKAVAPEGEMPGVDDLDPKAAHWDDSAHGETGLKAKDADGLNGKPEVV